LYSDRLLESLIYKATYANINQPFMANKSIHMSKLRHVLKLYCQGHSKLHISTTTGLSRNTVKKYLRIFISLKTTWEDIVKLTDKDLDELFNQEPPFTFDERIAVLHEFLKLEEKRLRQRGFTLLRLWENYHSGRV